jgi:hypothetical protein
MANIIFDFQKGKTMFKPLVLCSVLLFIAGNSIPGTAQSTLADEYQSSEELHLDQGVRFSLVQSDVALPGTDQHDWFKANFSGVSDSVPVNYTIVLDALPKGSEWIDFRQMTADWVARNSSSGSTPGQKGQASVERSTDSNTIECCSFGPPTPANPGTMIGDTTSLKFQCEQIDTSGQFAEVDYDYVWMYTKDTNGDGTPDSNPGWVLTAVGIKILSQQQQQNCSM